MSLAINHNLMAMNASRNLGTHYGSLSTSVRRLSSGLRVETAADDAAGLAIRETMRSDVTALNQGIRNANDAISMIQTADGALQVIDEKLIRMKELAMQAATGTYNSDQRLIIDSEFQAMKSEIERIAQSTEFNKIKLLQGDLTKTTNDPGFDLNLMLHLNFNGNIDDTSGNGFTSTSTGTTFVNGVEGDSAIEFNGVNSQMDTNFGMTGDEFTIQFWFNAQARFWAPMGRVCRPLGRAAALVGTGEPRSQGEHVMSFLYRSVVGGLDRSQWNGEAVVVFDSAPVDEGVPGNKVFRLHTLAPSAEPRPPAITPADLRDGVIFVLPDKEDAVNPEAVLDIQKRFVHAHYKYIAFPSRSHITVDPFSVRKKTHPDLFRTLNLLRNMPWALSSPLADKLSEARLGLPLLLLLPGPSVNDIAPQLPELRKHCLIACIARTLDICLEAGIHPDFVVQLDTFQVQRHFYDAIPALPETVLVALSLTPFHGYARKFRGVIMMDSFNLELLPNPSRLRESYVSSLTACLGLAEALGSPQGFVAGANLSFPPAPHAQGVWGCATSPIRLIEDSRTYLLSDRCGALVESRDWYIATATEADMFAEAIAGTAGTRFFSTTDGTLLSRKWFPHTPPRQIFSLPTIDRPAFLRDMDNVLARREEVDIAKTRLYLLSQLEEVRAAERQLAEGGPLSGDDPFVGMVKTLRDAPPGPETDIRGVAVRLHVAWRKALNNARLLVQGITLAERGKALPLLCFPKEIEAATSTLGRLIPKAKWEVYHIATGATPIPAGRQTVAHSGLLAWLDNRQVVFASARVLERFSHILELSPNENLFDSRLLFDQP